MKKTIKLTESDLIKIVNRIINEQTEPTEIKYTMITVWTSDGGEFDTKVPTDKVSEFCKKLDANDNVDYYSLNYRDSLSQDLDEKCWKGYTQKGMKTMFGKRYPNCVKKKK